MENGTHKSDPRQSTNTRRHTTQKSGHVLRSRKSKNKTSSQKSLSLSEKSASTVPNMTVLTPPPALGLSPTVSTHEPSRRTLSSGGVPTAAISDEKPKVPDIIVSLPAGEKSAEGLGTGLHSEVVSDNACALNLQLDSSKAETVDDKPWPLCGHGRDQLTGDGEKDVDPCRQSGANGGFLAGGTEDVSISDSSLNVDTQMLCAVAGPAAGGHYEVMNLVPPPTDALTVPTMTNGDEPSLENLNISSELDGLGPTSATCQYMKEFSTQKCVAATTVAEPGKDCENCGDGVDSMLVETDHDPHETGADLSVELVAASNFDRISAAGHNETNLQVAYSEEMFGDGDRCLNVSVVGNPKDRFSAGPNNGISSDLVEQLAAELNKSDLFASYMEEPEAPVGTKERSVDPLALGAKEYSGALLAPRISFDPACDSITNTMLDQAMAAVNQPTVSNKLQDVRCPTDTAAIDSNTNVVSGRHSAKPQADTHNSNPVVDAEAALYLLCDSSHISTKKPPKRRGRKRKSDSTDLFGKPGTSDDEQRKRRLLSQSPQLPADREGVDICLNQPVCGQTSFSVSFGSTSDSSAYVPPTPPSTATDKSSANTPRRLLGGVAGVTPAKSDQYVQRVDEAKKNVSQSKGGIEVEPTPCEAVGSVKSADRERESSLSAQSADLPSSQSFTIIDVAADRQLFDTFIAEWKQQQRFSLSLACEKRPKPRTQNSRRSTEGIGAKFTRGNSVVELGFWIVLLKLFSI